MTFLELFTQILTETGANENRLRAMIKTVKGGIGEELYQKWTHPIPEKDISRLREEVRAWVAEVTQHPEKYDSRSLDEKYMFESDVASHQLAELHHAQGHKGEDRPVKTRFFEVGQSIWARTYGKKPDLNGPREFMELFLQMCDELEKTDAERAEESRLSLRTEEGQFFYYESATWVHCGMPLVQLAGHRYAAALAATAVPHNIEIRNPWPVFMIELPTGMFCTDWEGEDEPLTHVTISRIPAEQCLNTDHDLWNISAHSSAGVALHRWRQPIEEMLDGDVEEDAPTGAFDQAMTSRDGRTLSLLTRIVFNTCILMSDPVNVRPIGKHPKNTSPGNVRLMKEPECRVYRVGKPIQLDVRPAIQDYLNGKRHGASPTVQFVVRGHWRNQACGPKLSSHKTIWIQPYWKGPEEAPINIRPHIIEEQENVL